MEKTRRAPQKSQACFSRRALSHANCAALSWARKKKAWSIHCVHGSSHYKGYNWQKKKAAITNIFAKSLIFTTRGYLPLSRSFFGMHERLEGFDQRQNVKCTKLWTRRIESFVTNGTNLLLQYGHLLIHRRLQCYRQWDVKRFNEEGRTLQKIRSGHQTAKHPTR